MLDTENALEVRTMLDKACKRAEEMEEAFLCYLIGMAKQECQTILAKHESSERENEAKNALPSESMHQDA